jgi:hypothetical protein
MMNIYIHCTIFLLIFLFYFWAGWLAPNFHVGNTNFENVRSVTFGQVITSNIQEVLTLVSANFGKYRSIKFGSPLILGSVQSKGGSKIVPIVGYWPEALALDIIFPIH